MGTSINSTHPDPHSIENRQPLHLELSIPSQIFQYEYADINKTGAELSYNTFYLMDSALSNRLYTTDPKNFGQRFKGILIRLPITLTFSFFNHELGHQDINPNALNPNATLQDYVDEINKVEYANYCSFLTSGGLENSSLLSTRIYLNNFKYQPNLSSSLFYFVLKLDYSLQKVAFSSEELLKYSPSNCLYGECLNDGSNNNISADPYELKESIVYSRNEYIRENYKMNSDDSKWTYSDADVGYDHKIQKLGLAFHLADPMMLWSTFHLLTGKDNLPRFLPQFDYLETIYGPTFTVNNSFITNGTQFNFGISETVNNQKTRNNGHGFETQITDIPLDKTALKLDLSYQYYLTPEKDELTNFGIGLKQSINENWGIDLAVDKKIGTGHLTGKQYHPSITATIGIDWYGIEKIKKDNIQRN